jgi:GT2 family glycosyltransferase
MRLVVIIPTLGRKEQVTRLLTHLEGQRRSPDEVIVSAPDGTHIEAYPARRFPLSYVFGKKGLSAQRNNALVQALARSDIVTFLDDDFIPADDYLERAVAAFAENPDWAVVNGRVVRDGVKTPGLSWEEGLAALCAAEARRPAQQVIDHVGAYGCNMSIRTRLIGELRFDERLVLYGWQEDIDFTSQLRRRGRVVAVSTLLGVHLGIKTGRVSGKRFGYSQIANPIYLIRKGTVPAAFALDLIGRNLLANALRSLWPEPHIDRRGRLRGNVLALRHLLTGRIKPEHILEL